MAAFQTVGCCVFEQSIVLHKAAVRNIYNVFKTSSMCIFDALFEIESHFVILVYIDSWRIKINNIMRIVKYEYDEYEYDVKISMNAYKYQKL